MEASNAYNTLFPLGCLPFQAWRDIADIIDGNMSNFLTLASHLQFDPSQSYAFWNRGLGGPENSATLHLIREYQQQGGTVQYLYWALQQMRSSAATVIRDYMPGVVSLYNRRTQARLNPRDGQQNPCRCISCTRNRPPLNHSIRAPEQSIPRRSIPERQFSQQDDHQTHSKQMQSDNIIHNPRSNTNGSLNTRNHKTGFDSVRNVQDNRQSSSMSQNFAQAGAQYQPCQCEMCRLSSDPHETQLLTPYDQEKSRCLRSQVENMHLLEDGGVSKVHMDSKADSQNDIDSKSKKKCSNSKEGNHYIGDRTADCRVCSLFKTGRRSWNGKDAPIDRIRNSSSDSSLNCQESSEVIYRRQNIDSLRPINSNTNNLNGQQNIPVSQSVNNSETNSATLTTPSDPEESSEPTQHDSAERDTRPIVLITYSKHSSQHLVEIKDFVSQCVKNDIRVKMDMHPDCFDELGVNRNEWLDQSVDRAKYVIICISPTYKEDVQGEQNPNDPTPQISQLNARYIYDRLRTEYINNQSQNRRMIPVLFPHSGALYETHVPQMMQATLVYTYPAHIQTIIDRILGRDRQLPYD